MIKKERQKNHYSFILKGETHGRRGKSHAISRGERHVKKGKMYFCESVENSFRFSCIYQSVGVGVEFLELYTSPWLGKIFKHQRGRKLFFSMDGYVFPLRFFCSLFFTFYCYFSVVFLKPVGRNAQVFSLMVFDKSVIHGFTLFRFSLYYETILAYCLLLAHRSLVLTSWAMLLPLFNCASKLGTFLNSRQPKFRFPLYSLKMNLLLEKKLSPF